MSSRPINELALAEARRWIGTPYCHQASACGVGADCLGLVRGIWRHLHGREPETLPGYSSDWGEIQGRETLHDAANRWCAAISPEEALPGDIIIFRWKQMVIAKHVGILSDPGRFIHAYERGGVVETTLGSHWRARIVAYFRFPEINLLN